MTFKITLLLISIITFLLNIPFGYWRANAKRFGLQWYLAVHLPVPAIIALRIFTGIGFHWTTYVALIAAYFFGQFLGGKIFLLRASKHKLPLTSCLVMDLYRCYAK
ncbi:MAG: hypothetical protein B6D64_01375 [Bacteroidetes bacterium 4484_276]|nr:MAG: hypothetical protein B6D64_01375 [Bacteroidetes bacterium 4484_276]